MPIADLNAWANNLELVRLPAIESDISDLQLEQVAQNTDLATFTQSWTDALAVQLVQTTAATTTAGAAQVLSFDTSTRIYANELYVQTHVAEQIQLLRNEIMGSDAAFTAYLSGDLETYIDAQVAALLPSLQATVTANTNSVAVLQGQIAASMAAAQAANDNIMNITMPAYDTALLDLDVAMGTLKNDFDLIVQDFGHETLVEGNLALQVTLENEIKSLTPHVLRLPHSSWIVDGDTSILTPKQPAVPAWFLTNDATFVDCVELPLGTDTKIGPAYPSEFSDTAIWEVSVRLKVSANGVSGTHIKIGATSFAGGVVSDLAAEKTMTVTPRMVADGEVVLKVKFSADLAKMTELGYSIGTGAANEAVHLAAAGARTKIFFYVRQNPGLTTTGRLRIQSIRATDITVAASAELFSAIAASSATAADVSADAAFTSATNAQTYATDAETRALASNTSMLAAQAAQAGSVAASVTAVAAKDNAEGSATAAQTALSLTSRVVGQGAGSLLDQFLGTTSGFAGWTTNPTWAVNAIYPQGRQATFALGANVQGGLVLLSDQSGGVWPGTKNAEAFYVEVDFTVNSGSTTGMGVHFDWQNTIGTTLRTSKPLTDMLAQPLLTGTLMTARAVFKRSAALTGTFARNRIYVQAADSTINASLAARNITIHRVTVRAATAEETGSGEVLASLSQVFRTGAQVDTAVSSGVNTYDAQISGGVAAKVTETANAMVTVNNNAAASYTLRVGAGGASAGFEVVAASDPIGGATSVIKMSAKHVEVLASSMRLSDSTNLFPDFDMKDPLFYSSTTAAVYSFVATASVPLGQNFISMSVSAAIEKVETGWFVLEPSAEYLVTGGAWTATSAAGSGTSTLTFETGSLNVAGVVTVLVATTIKATTDAGFNPVTSFGTATVIAGSTARRGRFVLTRAAGGTAAASTSGLKVQKKAGATLIVDGSFSARHVLAGSMSADDIKTGTMDAQNLTVTQLLKISTGTGALSVGKNSAFDLTNDGIFFGRTLEAGSAYGFGLLAGKKIGGVDQYIQATTQTGLKLVNANHYVSGLADPAAVNVTSSQTITLPVGTKILDLEYLGGGGGGAGATNDSGHTVIVASNGGSTVIQLWDGAVNTGVSWTATGGLGATAIHAGDGGYAGANSAFGTGGAGGAYSGAGTGAGGIASGYGAGGGGGGGTEKGGNGGGASALISVNDYDISALAAPKLVITIGATGGGSAGQSGAGAGAAGSPGIVKYTAKTLTQLPASVLPLQPTYTGTLSKAASSVLVFPDYGAGLWCLSADGTTGISLFVVETHVSGATIRLSEMQQFASFISDKTPVDLVLSTVATTYTYQFYKLGNWV